MSKEEMQKEIDICKTVGESSDEKLVELVRGIFKEKLTVLESQLESEQPKLRHGACGVDDNGNPFVIIEHKTIQSLDGRPKAIYGDQGGQINADKYLSDAFVLIPDIFTDLADMSKDLDEFYVDGFHVSIFRDKIMFGGKPLTKENAIELWRLTGRVIATVKRRAGQI